MYYYKYDLIQKQIALSFSGLRDSFLDEAVEEASMREGRFPSSLTAHLINSSHQRRRHSSRSHTPGNALLQPSARDVSQAGLTLKGILCLRLKSTGHKGMCPLSSHFDLDTCCSFLLKNIPSLLLSVSSSLPFHI